MKVSAILVVFGLALFASCSAEKCVVCYYGAWAVYRPPGGKVDVTDLDASKCTHMIYTFVGISGQGGINILDAWHEIDLKGFENMKALKKVNPKIKNLIAIGGWNEASGNFSPVSQNAQLRKDFAKNAVAFMEKYGFDGFDMDWEYPADRGGNANDKASFILMLQELRNAFGNKYLLTAAVGAGKERRIQSYDVPGMNKYLDFINLMAYDLHGQWESQTGHHAALNARSADWNKDLNIRAIVSDWRQAGASPEKLVLGLGLYGRSFTLASASNNGMGAPTIGGGEAGKYTREKGSLSFTEICENLKNGWTEKWDDEQQVPYAYSGNQWVGYDNVRSLELKCDLINEQNLAGGMVWSIEQDDVYNACGWGKYSLLTAINRKLRNGSGPSPTSPPTSKPTSGPVIPTTSKPTANPSAPFKCTSEGYIRDPKDCSKFYYCNNQMSATQYSCGAGTLFDETIKGCNHAANVKC